MTVERDEAQPVRVRKHKKRNDDADIAFVASTPENVEEPT